MNHNEKIFNLDQTTNSAERDNEILDSNYEAEKKITEEANENDTNDNITVPYYENLSANFMDLKKEFVETKQFKVEVANLFDNLSRAMKDTVLLVGHEGTGKTSIVEQLTQKINEKDCPKNFYDTTVIRIKGDILSADLTANQLIYILSLILKDVSKCSNKVILNFEDIEDFPASFFLEFNSIGQYLIRVEGIDKIWFVLTLDKSFYDDIPKKSILSFSKIGLIFMVCPDYKLEELPRILKPRIDEISKLHSNVKISTEMLEKSLVLSYMRISTDIGFNLTYILHMIDLLMAKAENNGKKYVSMKELEDCFFKDFELMRKLSKEQLELIAYHESGHCLISLLNLDLFETLAVKIVPDYTTSSLGSTTTRYKFCEGFYTREIMKKECAFCLAGKHSQEKYNPESNLNVKGDLIKVRNSVLAWVQGSGTIETIGINSIIDDESCIPEWQSKILENECNSLIEEATTYVKEVIDKNFDFIKILVKNLMKYKVLTKKELLKIWNNYQKENN